MIILQAYVSCQTRRWFAAFESKSDSLKDIETSLGGACSVCFPWPCAKHCILQCWQLRHLRRHSNHFLSCFDFEIVKRKKGREKSLTITLWRMAGDNFCLQSMFVRDPYPCRHRCCETSVSNVLHMDNFPWFFPFPMFVICFVLGTRLEAMACGITTLRRSKKWQQSRCDDFQCHNGKLWQTAPWIQGLYLYGNAIFEMCLYRCVESRFLAPKS